MNEEKEYNKLMIRWLEGDLQGEELSEFEASPQFQHYKKIIDTADKLSYPTLDETAAFDNIQERITSSRKNTTVPKVMPLRRWILGVAAILVLGFAVLQIIPKPIDITAGVGQYVSHTLPDGSEVNLNGNSSIQYNKDFDQNRILELNGEAFFEVKKGQSFVVETPGGSVSVLGTSFNVFSRSEIFIVSCKTGKVKVQSKKHSAILEAGEQIQINEESTIGKQTISDDSIASWLDGTSYFSDSRLEEVILSMESHYTTKVTLPEHFKNKRFTGSYVHNDIEKALKMVFSPMGISYSYSESGEVLFTDK